MIKRVIVLMISSCEMSSDNADGRYFSTHGSDSLLAAADEEEEEAAAAEDEEDDDDDEEEDEDDDEDEASSASFISTLATALAMVYALLFKGCVRAKSLMKPHCF